MPQDKAKLVIAKLDRLSRNLAFIATLLDSGVEFVAANNPHANRLTVHILAAVAEHERAAISEQGRPGGRQTARQAANSITACGHISFVLKFATGGHAVSSSRTAPSRPHVSPQPQAWC
jgi:hypothetical protein